MAHNSITLDEKEIQVLLLLNHGKVVHKLF